MPSPSRRASSVAPFMVMDVMTAAAARERSGLAVVHMEVGQPSVGAPRPVIEATRAALASGRVPYTEALGCRSSGSGSRRITGPATASTCRPSGSS